MSILTSIKDLIRPVEESLAVELINIHENYKKKNDVNNICRKNQIFKMFTSN